jgi:isoquinoline 1-oxidoreductase beta subunit
VNRRTFLWTGTAGGAGLLIGFDLFGCDAKDKPKAPPKPKDPTAGTPGAEYDVNAYVRIGTDDSITIIVPESEMGQGVLTSVAMIVAEELGADWKRVRSEHALANKEKYGRQGTGGSTTIRKGLEQFQRAGATARAMLIEAAAQQWKVPAAECTVARGVIAHANSKATATFGSVAQAASKLEPPAELPALRDPKSYEIIGKAVQRLDLPPKTDGTAVFGIDVKVPDMLTAQVVHPPAFGGKLESVDAAAAKAVPGVVDVVEIPTGVAVIAKHFWAAKLGRDALKVTWDDGPHAGLSSAKITAMCKKIAGKGVQARAEGDAAAALKKAKRKLSAVYEVPYLAHATMEPMNCTADVRADRCEVWAPTQTPSGTQDTAAEITGLDPDKIVVHTTLMGGGFGRRSQTDFVADAVHASKAAGKPVKVVWTREDDTRGGWYRPMAYNELEGAVDAEGWPVAWVHRIASPSILEGFGREIPGGVDPTSIDGAADLPYAIPNLRVTCAKPDLPITLWFWRSVGSSQNAYVTECFFDELCALGGVDPLAARLRLLSGEPRIKKVVEVVADKAGWSSPVAEGHARGIAVRESFGSICAQVADVSIDNGAPRVHSIVCAVDPGQVVNPDTIEAQMESGIAYGLSAALFGEITIDKGRAVQGNFDTYPVVRMPHMPRVATHIVPSGDAHGGIGEPGLPPAAPAVCNALRALTGKPVRSLPIRL